MQYRIKKVHLFLFFVSVFFLIEIFLALLAYRIVTTTQDSLPSSFQRHQNNYNKNNEQDRGRHRHHRRSPDGRFNGYPMYFHDLSKNATYHSRPYSSIRCVGENYQGGKTTWMYRSCHFRFLCFNVSSREFEVYARPDDDTIQSIAAHRRPLIDFSTVFPPTTTTRAIDRDYNESFGMSLASGIIQHLAHKKDGNDDGDQRRRMKNTFNWFPTVVQSLPPERYYALEDDFVMVPFHSLYTGPVDSGPVDSYKYSVVWDDLFPIWTLLNMFQLLSPSDDHREALLMRYVPLTSKSKSNETMNHYNNNNDGENKMDLFRHLMVRHGYVDQSYSRRTSRITNLTTQRNDIDLTSSSLPSSQQIKPLRSNLVCARDAVAGLGPHGIRDTKNSALHNYGRGGILWMFRNYCLSNLRLSSVTNDRHKNFRIIFAGDLFTNHNEKEMTLQNKNEGSNFALLKEGLRRSLDYDESTSNQNYNITNHNVTRIEIESHDFSDKNVTDHIRLMVDSSIFISFCSDLTTVLASFLPRGATLIIFYYEKMEIRYESTGGTKNINTIPQSTCRHHYQDLLNNLSYVRVHWLPMIDKECLEQDLDVLYNLVKHEIKLQKRNSNNN